MPKMGFDDRVAGPPPPSKSAPEGNLGGQRQNDSGSSTQPFSDSGEVQRHLDAARVDFQKGKAREIATVESVGPPPPSESAPEGNLGGQRQTESGSSTQPFSDSEELQRHLDAARVNFQKGKAREIAVVEPTDPRVSDLATDLATDLASALAKASLTSKPDARLLLAFQRQAPSMGSAVFRLPSTVEGWDLISVVQRTRDVDFTIQMPFYDKPYDTPPPRRIPYDLVCTVHYNPANDDCLLVSATIETIYLTELGPGGGTSQLSRSQDRVLKPGMWRISVGGSNGIVEQHLIELLVLRRKFSVTIHKAPTGRPTAAKRVASDEEGIAAKRRKGDEDVTEVFIAPIAQTLQLAPWPSVPDTKAGLMPALTPARKIIKTDGTPLLDLLDDELAIIQSSLPIDLTPEVPRSASGTNGPANYELSRFKRIADTKSASLFIGVHSVLSEQVVAKVIRYEGKRVRDLRNCARNWKQEMVFLERLRHDNIISLKAFDGRVFAIYVEPLPASLNRGLESTFDASDAHTILRDMSSALAYLAKLEIVHNDIKPGNIAFSPQRGAVLLDFGLASSLYDSTAASGGTPWYVPPELPKVGTRGLPGDVWALGVTMLYVLRKTQLPERTTKQQWMIHKLREKGQNTDKSMMVDWTDSVHRLRSKLNREDFLESLVYQMLDPDGKTRILASRLAAEFGSTSRSITAGPKEGQV